MRRASEDDDLVVKTRDDVDGVVEMSDDPTILYNEMKINIRISQVT